MSRAVKTLGTICLMLGLGNAWSAVGPALRSAGAVADPAVFQAAARQQHQLDAQDGATRCEMSRINDAVALIYQQDDSAGALAMAQRCEVLSVAQSRSEYQTLASRIKALVAIKARDMQALQSAGEALLAAGGTPEFVADGHLFIAFACTFSGRAGCARTHLDQAKAMFTRHDVAGAMEQLMSVEQALLKLEAAPGH